MMRTAQNQRNSEQRSLQSIGQLIDELKSDDLRRRANSVKNLGAIAQALGPERTRSELVPFIMELIDDEDEVLTALADSLSNFIDYVGGPQYSTVLIQPLEQMCFLEESAIREKATNSLKNVINTINVAQNEEIVVGLVKRLSNCDYHSAKGAAASIIPFIYSKVSSAAQSEFLKIYISMIKSDIPTIRKNATIFLKDLVILIPKTPENDMISLIKLIIKDDQDYVRLYIMDSIVSLAKAIPPAKHASIVFPLLKVLAEDPSWRIRYVVCDKINDLAEIIGKEQTIKVLLPYYSKFLSDGEAELRNIACTRLAKFCQYLDNDNIIREIIPCLKPLSTDSQSYVRASLASSLLAISPQIGKQNTNDFIMEIFFNLLKDENSDVRLNIFKGLEEFTKVMGAEVLYQSLVPALTELAVDKNWRIRLSSIEFMTFFARAIGQNFLNDKLSKILLDWLSDRVFAVREAAVQCVQDLSKTLGGPWAEKHLVQKIYVFQNNPNYLFRMTTLFALQAIAEYLSGDFIAKNVIPNVCQMSKDKVPNVRMNVAKTLKVLMTKTKDKSAEELGKRTLQLLLGDADSDVKYVSKTVLDSL